LYLTCKVLKKYFPLVALLAAALLFFWVKKNQRDEPVHIPVNIEEKVTGKDPFARDTAHIVYSRHARCRMDCRHIDESEVKEILLQGKVNYDKIEESAKGSSYPLEGTTHDNQHARVVFASMQGWYLRHMKMNWLLLR